MKKFSLQRIKRDLKEIHKSPLEGIGIISLDNDPMKYLVNIQIMSGIYEGYCLQLLLTISDNFPIKPPKILIYPGQYLDNTFHHHIFKSDICDDKGNYFHKFCFDLLENDFLPTSSMEYTGWNPSYTISTLLLQVQIFLSNPDYPNGYIPCKEKIDELMKSMDNYEKIFIIKNENNQEITKKHTWKNPYPEMYFKKEKIIIKIVEEKNSSHLDEMKENLSCFISRLNYIEDKDVLLGYPIKRKGIRNLIPIPEILSYDCFIKESSKYNLENNNVFSTFNNNIGSLIIGGYRRNRQNYIILDEIPNLFFNSHFSYNSYNNDFSFKSASNEFYDTWLPIYINKEHFEKNKTTILNFFSVIKYGNTGNKKYDFHPQYIFEIMPNILSGMIIKMSKNNISSSFLKCFFQYILLFKRLEKKYNNILKKFQKLCLNRFMNKVFEIDKINNIKKELLELMILFFYCDNEMNPEMKSYIRNIMKQLQNLILLILFEDNKYFSFKNQKSFINDLKKYNLFDKIVDIIFIESRYLFLDENNLILSDLLRSKIIKQMNLDFKGLFSKLDYQIKNKIKHILLNEINLANYFDLNSINNCIKKNCSNNTEIPTINKLILIFTLLRKKSLSNHFLNDLEKNYGIFLDIEPFIEDLNKRIKSCNDIEVILKTLFNQKNNEVINNIISLIAFDEMVYEIPCLNLETKKKIFVYEKYPFAGYYNFDNRNILAISDKTYNIIQKEKEFYRDNNIAILFKKGKKHNTNKDIIRKQRINIKKSYNNIYKKSIQKFVNKKYINKLYYYKLYKY